MDCIYKTFTLSQISVIHPHPLELAFVGHSTSYQVPGDRVQYLFTANSARHVRDQL